MCDHHWNNMWQHYHAGQRAQALAKYNAYKNCMIQLGGGRLLLRQLPAGVWEWMNDAEAGAGSGAAGAGAGSGAAGAGASGGRHRSRRSGRRSSRRRSHSRRSSRRI